ncbi:MAG: RES family NAD+ phosphorylase [Steroidobacteraceae bacterium]
MSSTTWTPAAVASEGRRWQGNVWRAIEAQHRVSTLRLVDTLEEQAQLEALLETSKPALPVTAAPRHYLLLTPFRYPARHPGGSRFRAVSDGGVFYGADERRTACAELGYWRWRFLMDSPALPRLAPLLHTLFQSEVAGLAIDLRQPPFSAQAHRWTASQDYGACQQLGALARKAGIELIRYQSVRDPQAGACTAVLTPEAFTAAPLTEQTWRLTVTRQRVQWQRDSMLQPESLEFLADWDHT